MKGQKANVWLGLAALVYGGLMFWYSLPMGYYTKMGPGPGFFPIWISGIIIVLSIIFIGMSLKEAGVLFGDIIPKGRDLVNNLSVLAAVIVFMLIVNIAGFITACTVLMFMILGLQYKWHLALGISIVTAVVLFATFQFVLDIPLPVNMFGW